MNAYHSGSTIIAPRRAEGPDALGDAWIALEPGTDEYQMWDDWLRAVEAMTVEATAGVDTHPGGEPTIVEMLDFIQAAARHDVTAGHDELHHYWTVGKGRGEWVGSPTPWTTLVALLIEHAHVSPVVAKTWASRWFIEVFGYAAGSDKNRVAHGHPPRGHVVGPG